VRLSDNIYTVFRFTGSANGIHVTIIEYSYLKNSMKMKTVSLNVNVSVIKSVKLLVK
jgi:hypothetical protein